MKTIPLTQGKETIVDDFDFETFSIFKWHYNNGYAKREVGLSDGSRKTILLHRLIALARDEEYVHHVDGNTLNNCAENLQTMSRSDHIKYHQSKNGPKTGNYRGVSMYKHRKNRWHAQININNRTRSLGYYYTEEEAAKAWDRAAIEYYGPDVYQNFK